MKKVELIICMDNGSWDANVFAEIPDHLHTLRDVDAIAAWLIDNEKINAPADAVYIGVYNWDADYTESENV